MKKVAIITVNYNGKKDTLEFLTSLKSLKADGCQLKTIIVDNASSDGSVPAIHNAYPEVDIIQTGSNSGFSGGYNRGIEYAQIWGADYFLLINNDALIKDENLLGELIKTAESDPRIGIVSPKIYFAPGFEFHKDRYKKNDKGQVIWYAGGSFDWNNVMGVHRGIDEVDAGKYDGTEETEFVSGACMLIKKEVVEEVGMFDNDYFLYFEDQDFQKRILESGFKLYYNGGVAIYHKVSRSTGIGSIVTDYYHTRNRLILGMKYAKSRTKFALLREAFKLFISGRPAQRQGILDFYLGNWGRCDLNQGPTKTLDAPEHVEYPLKLSIGIVNYNTADLTKKLVESIFKKDSGFDPKTMEVIVLDNGDVDPCVDKIKEYLLASRSGSKIKYLKNEENEGFSKGYNRTIKYSLGEYYLMLNSDIEVIKNGLSEMVKWADHYNGEAVLGGKLVFPDKSDQDSAFHLPTLWGAFKEYFLGIKGSYFMYLPKSDKPSKVEGLVMACLLIPKKILSKVGLLDEGTFIFFEDIEYARRLKKLKIPLYFIPSAHFIHHHGASTKRIGQEKAYDLLQKSAEHYHGVFYYTLLSWVLRIGQKLGRVKTPISRWVKD
ncbi:MAG: glycosyltransferase family 2 protein [Candidatus Daviesbacteria bacterium]|nr:glycosyltransferase family 2 protein [Candidatus Daviesbacteria bacterium]